jgi:Fe-S-cluster-containing hydrogenase component 2
MKPEEKRPGEIDRRKFIAEASTLALGGAAAALAACAPAARKAGELPVSGMVLHDPARCVGCGVCTMMCSLSHEGQVGPALSRAELIREPFTYDFAYRVCEQCASPECYVACPLKDKARCIDERTGARYVNRAECIGCGECIAACPLTPPRTRMHPEEGVAITCDLCMDRKEGPLCVDYCPMDALKYVRKEKRRG